jgi:RNA polymerase sigma-70 factor (ECF subfamily)
VSPSSGRRKWKPVHWMTRILLFNLKNQESSFNANLMEQKSRVNRVNEAISQLSADDAQIISLFYKGDQSLEEIGVIMGMDANTIKVRLHRARHKLKDKLEKDYKSEAI